MEILDLLVIAVIIWAVYTFTKKESFRQLKNNYGREQINQARLDIIFGGSRFDEKNSILNSKCGDDPSGCRFFTQEKI